MNEPIPLIKNAIAMVEHNRRILKAEEDIVLDSDIFMVIWRFITQIELRICSNGTGSSAIAAIFKYIIANGNVFDRARFIPVLIIARKVNGSSAIIKMAVFY